LPARATNHQRDDVVFARGFSEMSKTKRDRAMGGLFKRWFGHKADEPKMRLA
jgi:hypothetical protein